MQTRWLQFGVSVAIGAAAADVTRSLGIPGGGEWIAGGVAAILGPSWLSFAGCVTGIVLATVYFVTSAGQYGGLAWLVVACEAAILGHGFLVLASVRRATRVRTLIDARVIAGLGTAAGLVVLFVLIAQDFARNPP